MIGGLPVWFRVSDTQIARLRRYCIRTLIVCFAGLCLSDILSGRDSYLSAALAFLSFPICTLGVLVSFLVPTVRLRLFWTLPPITLGWLALLHRYAELAGLQPSGGDLVLMIVFLIGGVTIYALALMTMAEAGQGKGLQVMSADWKTVKE
ncbi:MAG: hypothetical protein O9308_15880 [Beijerinckiaceae bacterium]|nr:hypothetical protein [Beijerinckiaceae bacterium]